MDKTYALELDGITKRFGQFTANDNISFKIRKGSIFAIAGENGAGKTTLMNIVYGLYSPSEGTMSVYDKQVKFSSSKDAIRAGIGMVHQHFMLVPRLSVAENIIAGMETGSKWKINLEEAHEKIDALSEKYGMKIDSRMKIRDLSVAMQQRVEILKVLYRNADILIFDEPTAVLTKQEIDEFCEILLKLKERGKTILFISHKLNEVMKVADEVMVIRLGKKIGQVKNGETSPEEITQMMVGRNVELGGGAKTEQKDKMPVLCLKDLFYKDRRGVEKISNLSLTLYKGEILGLAGVDGNGQEELAELLCGRYAPLSGEINLLENRIDKISIRDRKKAGLGYIPEDRHKDGLILDFSISENMILGQHRSEAFTNKKVLVNPNSVTTYTEDLIKDFDIRCGGASHPASSLSGGNQQKIVIAREVSRNPEAILAVQPTRGLDVGAIEYIHKVLVHERNKGKGILLMSLELDEILTLSDRIAVIYKGKIVGIVKAKETTKNELGLMMLGKMEVKETKK